MGLSKEIADLIQKDTDTNIRIDDLELAVEDIESEVVKVTDEDYKKGPNYFTNTPLMEPADNGEEITTIRSDFINADSKLQVGMTQQGLPPEIPINSVTITVNAYDIIPVNIYFARNMLITSKYISGYGDDGPENPKYPYDGNTTYGSITAYVYYGVSIPVTYNITISPKETSYTKLPIIYTEESYSEIRHVDFGLVSGVDWAGLTYTYRGYYSTGKLESRNVEGYYQPSIHIDPKYEEVGRQISPIIGGMFYNTADIEEFIKNQESTSTSIEYWYDPDYEVNTKWEVTRKISCEGDTNVNISRLISWNGETNSYIFNGGNTLISGSEASSNNPETRVFGCFSFNGTSGITNFENGSTSIRSDFISSNDIIIDTVMANLWGNHIQWNDYEPSNSDIYNYSKTDRSTPNREGVNASGTISSTIKLEDDTIINKELPVFYLYQRYNEFFEARHYNRSGDAYYTSYTRAKYLEFKKFEADGYIKELPNNYDVLLGSKNRTVDDNYDAIYKNNNSYLGIENYIFGDVKNTKVIGNYNHLYLNDDSAIIIGNYNEIKTLQRDDILISNDGVGFIIRDGKQYLHFKDNIIPMDSMYSLSRYSEDDSYICLMNFNGDILSKIYAPYELKCDENGISLGNNVIRFPTDTEIGDMFNDESTMSLYYPISYNSLKIFYNYLKEHGLEYYVFGSDDLGLYLEDYKKIKRYVTWESFSEDDYVDIFNNTDSYEYGGKKLW